MPLDPLKRNLGHAAHVIMLLHVFTFDPCLPLSLQGSLEFPSAGGELR